jgi:WD40 repeat protein/tRNA A-37 threonylcarbamoyl transferase component Bud32
VNERDIFHAAIELTDPAERSAYLEKVCAGNASLRRHVEGMLQVYPELGTFLESPAVDLEGAASPPVSAGRFQLGRELARGGMGVVYCARDESLGRDVAVKVLHERYLVDSLVGERFLDEARITAQLQHPGIPPVFEVGQLDDERPYLAMKLIKGRTLEELLTERSELASDRGRFLAVFEQICQAVAYAHSKHILHRDLKPANVMVGAFGEVQVMDWGLAKLLPPGGAAVHEPAVDTETAGGTVIQTARERDSATLAGSMLGTPAFMAPEQAGGEVDRIDERTDVFGLGAILCVILTGEPPYSGKSGEELRLMAIRGTLAAAHARLEECGADAKLVELCRSCLSAERAARPRDAGAVAATVAGYLAGVEERARQAERERAAAEARAVEQRKRRRVQLALAAAVLLALVGGIVATTWQALRATQAEADALSEAGRALTNQREAEQAKEQTKEQLWKALLSQARANRRSGQPGRNFKSLDVLRRAAALRPSLELRNEAIACMALPDLRLARQWDYGIPRCYGLAFDAELERYAFSDEQGTISIRRFADNRELLRLAGGGVPAWVLKFSPDHRFLAARCHPPGGDTNTILVWDIGKAIATGAVPADPLQLTGQFWDFHPDSRHLAASCLHNSLRLYDLFGKEPPRELSRDEPIWCLAFDPEGRRLAAARNSSLIESGERVYPIVLHDVQTGKCLCRLRSPAQVRNMAWHADGRRLAGAAMDSNVYLWQPPSERPVKTLIGHENSVSNIAFHPGGELLVSIGWDGVGRLWNAETGRQLLSSPAAETPLRFSRDGRRFALSMGPARVGLYDIDPGHVCRTMYGRSETGTGLWSAAFHSDKPLLATTSFDCVRLWDADSGREIAAQHLRDCQSAFFLPDGDLLTSGASGPECWRLTFPPEWRVVSGEWSVEGAAPATLHAPPSTHYRAHLERLPWAGPKMRDTRRMTLAPDARTLAVLINLRQLVVLGDDQWTRRLLDLPAPRVDSIALSPDGQWAATGTWRGAGTRIWDLHTGQQIGKELPGGDAFVAFSPDGRWLVNGTQNDYRFWEVGSWRPGLRIPRTPPTAAGPLAFSTDGKILAIAHSYREVRLIETASGRELATLAAPEPHPVRWLCFRPDGEQLAVACEKGVLQLWHLRRLRQRLTELGLDWD